MAVAPPPDTPLYRKDWQPELPASFREDFNQTHSEAKPTAHREWDRIVRAQFGGLDAEDEAGWKAHLNYYYNQIRDVDRCIQRILETLEDLGMADETIVVLTADHGDMTGSHGLRQKGPMIYRENNNVPLIIAHPEGQKGVARDNLFSALDLAPTLVSLAGGAPEGYEQLKGIDLSPTLWQEKPTNRDERGVLFTYAAFNSVDADFIIALSKLDLSTPPTPDELKGLVPDLSKRGHLRGILHGRYKFARYFAPTNYQRPQTFEELVANNELELYDLENDPDEIDNLANRAEQHRELITRLNQKLDALIQAEIGEDPGPCIPAPHEILPQEN